MENKLLWMGIAVFLFVVVSLSGTFLLQRIANKKWGYTPKREKELEEQKYLRNTGRYGKIGTKKHRSR